MIKKAKDTLGDDVVLDFGRAAIDRRRLAEEPGAHATEFGFGEAVALPAEALQAHDLDRQFAAFLGQLGAQLLEHRRPSDVGIDQHHRVVQFGSDAHGQIDGGETLALAGHGAGDHDQVAIGHGRRTLATGVVQQRPLDDAKLVGHRAARRRGRDDARSGNGIEIQIDWRIAGKPPTQEPAVSRTRTRGEDYAEASDKLISRIKFIGSGRENIYSISYQDESPDRAKRVVQDLLSLFVESGVGNKRRDTEAAIKFIDEQIKTYESKLEEAEGRLKVPLAVLEKHLQAQNAQGQAYLAANRFTVADVERGKPGTSIAADLGALWVLGLLDQLAEVADPDRDGEGKALEAARQPGQAPRRRRFDDDF